MVYQTSVELVSLLCVPTPSAGCVYLCSLWMQDLPQTRLRLPSSHTLGWLVLHGKPAWEKPAQRWEICRRTCLCTLTNSPIEKEPTELLGPMELNRVLKRRNTMAKNFFFFLVLQTDRCISKMLLTKAVASRKALSAWVRTHEGCISELSAWFAGSRTDQSIFPTVQLAGGSLPFACG